MYEIAAIGLSSMLVTKEFTIADSLNFSAFLCALTVQHPPSYDFEEEVDPEEDGGTQPEAVVQPQGPMTRARAKAMAQPNP